MSREAMKDNLSDAFATFNRMLAGQGKIIFGVDSTNGWKQKVPILCKNYPDQCSTCKMRFICWTTREAEFDLNQLRKAGVYKDR